MQKESPLFGIEAAQYLRKSRMEEGLDTDEVLSKHRKALSDFAQANGIHVIETYYEVRSGESLYARPEMLRLLEDVEAGRYEAVLCMDLDRLSRGRMKDQGIILDTFRESGTKIITPEKTYDLEDEMDDEMAEFKTFMSRREYKIINKRLRRGLHQTIQSGCYVANAPYGYKRITVDRKPTLEIYEPEARFVRMIYQLYLQGHGCTSIARTIHTLGARPHRAEAFNRTSIAQILKNPTYTGKIVWDQKKHIRKGSHGNPKHITIYQPREKWTIVDGIHPAIIDQETYDRAQDILTKRYQPPKNDGTVKSPLAGLVRCETCKKHMQRMGREGTIPYLLCNTKGCCAGAKFELVEQAVLDLLAEQLVILEMAQPEHSSQDTSAEEAVLAGLQREQSAAAGQKARLYELLELGEYDIPTFRERMTAVKEKIARLEKEEAQIKASLKNKLHNDPVLQAQRIRAVLDAYGTSEPPARNAMLKSVVETVWYAKDKKTKPSDFRLKLDLKPTGLNP